MADKLVLANRKDSPPDMAKTMWQVACADDITFMAILHTTSLLRDAARGSGITRECRLWEQRTVQALSQRILSGGPISDATVAAVAALAACEVGHYCRYSVWEDLYSHEQELRRRIPTISSALRRHAHNVGTARWHRHF